MSKRNNVYSVTISGNQNAFFKKAIASLPSVTPSVVIRQLCLKWASGVTGEPVPEAGEFGRGKKATPNGLTAQARRLGMKPRDLQKKLLTEALERLAKSGDVAAE